MSRSVTPAVCAAALLVVIPASLAFKGGADPGRSGGFVAGGDNCTACHPFNSGAGQVELLYDAGMGNLEPVRLLRRYRVGAVYGLTIRVTDPEPAGAGFELSAEGDSGHAGSLAVTEVDNTQYADGDTGYVTHTSDGVRDSIDQWHANDGYSEYHLQWQAPNGDEDLITFFVAANALKDPGGFGAVRYYIDFATMGYAVPGDGDGDTDIDLFDFAAFQRCFNGEGPVAGPGCEHVDLSTADFVAAFTGPTATAPAGFVMADPVRGGLLYDQWWTVTEVDGPTADHPLWATRPDTTSNGRAGSATWRCKECHGWDYKGVDGAYGAGDHRTGFTGIYGTTASARGLFDRLNDPNDHAYGGVGLGEEDIWDLVKFALEGVIDTDSYIHPVGFFFGNSAAGAAIYNPDGSCQSCHGFDGEAIPLNTDAGEESVGQLARRDPWEFLHKVRFGDPGTPMPAFEVLRWEVSVAADVGAYSTTLP